jgi:protein-tyrosine phosphatase
MLAEQPFATRVSVDSAGTGDWHVGKAPDRRAQAAATKRGYDLSELRARQLVAADFERFDYILAMDENNYRDLLARAPAQYHTKVRLFLDYAPACHVTAVPDPYYNGEAGFEVVLDLIEAASAGLIERIKSDDFF